VVALARSYGGSGTFGHSCYEDAAQAAAIMSQQVGGDFSPDPKFTVAMDNKVYYDPFHSAQDPGCDCRPTRSAQRPLD
jgi:hypothetical protein